MSKTNQESPSPYMSNADLKTAADAEYQQLALALQSVYSDLSNALDDEERRALAEAQEAWNIFAEKQATFSSGLMRGGTGESLLYLEEMNSQMRTRVVTLRDALKERSPA